MGLSWDSTGISVEYGTLMMDVWNIMMDIYIYHGTNECEYGGIYIST